MIKGATGLREWSAPETRKSAYNSCKIDLWTLGCLMYFLCTGNQPFEPEDSLTTSINFVHKLMEYSDSRTFSDMVDFISRLLVVDPDKRMSA